jgi:hypothetical protein
VKRKRFAWAAGFDVAQQHVVLFAPGPDGTPVELRTVIDVDLLRQATSFGKLLQYPDNS